MAATLKHLLQICCADSSNKVQSKAAVQTGTKGDTKHIWDEETNICASWKPVITFGCYGNQKILRLITKKSSIASSSPKVGQAEINQSDNCKTSTGSLIAILVSILHYIWLLRQTFLVLTNIYHQHLGQGKRSLHFLFIYKYTDHNPNEHFGASLFLVYESLGLL